MSLLNDLYDAVSTVLLNSNSFLDSIGVDPKKNILESFYMSGGSCRAEISNQLSGEVTVKFIQTVLVIDFLEELKDETVHQ